MPYVILYVFNHFQLILYLIIFNLMAIIVDQNEYTASYILLILFYF